MHTTLLSWLASFEESVLSNTPTEIYSHLVQMGVEKPNSTCIAPRSGNATGCDCQEIIANAQKHIRESEEWIRQFPYDVERKRKYIEREQEEIALYTSIHASHAEYNRYVYEILLKHGKLAKVRSVCLRDLRGGIVKSYPALVGETSGSDYCRHALKSYGEELKTFLVSKPEGWF